VTRLSRDALTRLSWLLALLGLAGTTLLIAWFGAGAIMRAFLSVGPAGFLGYVAWQAAVLVLLGVAWWAIAPPGERAAIYVWGRMVRDSAASCLPFSPVGGFVLGARAVVLCGVSTSAASLSTVADLTAEFVAEILFLIIGLVIVLGSSHGLTLPVEAGIAAAIVGGAATLRLQQHAVPLCLRLGRRLRRQWFPPDAADDAGSDLALTALFGDGRRVLAGTLLHLLGWIAKGAGNWIAFALVGHPIDMASALALEALLHAMLAVAILVPGYAGVQEAGYAGLGTLFGAPPEISISVSLLRRARDLALGLPILLLWQMVELRALPGRASKP
jgi:putative membrane protein